jgi:5'-3' exonuclease
VDASIFLYKYKKHEKLEYNMKRLINKLIRYNIIPIFIFDGIAPPEKRGVIRSRYISRRIAEKQYQEHLDKIDDNIDDERKRVLEEEIETLRLQCVRITKEDINSIKRLLDAEKIQWKVAEGEADRLCVELVLQGHAWACLSDDMDMFIYGCPRVMRHISLRDDTVLFYNTSAILQDIGMDLDLFRKAMILSGTDYNPNINTDIHLYTILDLAT